MQINVLFILYIFSSYPFFKDVKSSTQRNKALSFVECVSVPLEKINRSIKQIFYLFSPKKRILY